MRHSRLQGFLLVRFAVKRTRLRNDWADGVTMHRQEAPVLEVLNGDNIVEPAFDKGDNTVIILCMVKAADDEMKIKYVAEFAVIYEEGGRNVSVERLHLLAVYRSTKLYAQWAGFASNRLHQDTQGKRKGTIRGAGHKLRLRIGSARILPDNYSGNGNLPSDVVELLSPPKTSRDVVVS